MLLKQSGYLVFIDLHILLHLEHLGPVFDICILVCLVQCCKCTFISLTLLVRLVIRFVPLLPLFVDDVFLLYKRGSLGVFLRHPIHWGL